MKANACINNLFPFFWEFGNRKGKGLREALKRTKIPHLGHFHGNEIEKREMLRG